jgi:hypothetical protein
MRRSSGSMVDVGSFGICTGIPVVLVFWWVFFTGNLSGPAAVVETVSRRALV